MSWKWCHFPNTYKDVVFYYYGPIKSETLVFFVFVPAGLQKKEKKEKEIPPNE